MLAKYVRVVVVILAVCTIVVGVLALLKKVPTTWVVVLGLVTATMSLYSAYLAERH